jgi:hypothetical protein
MSFIALCLSFSSAVSQNRPVPKLLRHLIHHQGSIPIISGGAHNLVPSSYLSNYINDEYQNLIKTDDALYCNINGTGWLYKVTDTNELLAFQKVDSSFYAGNNFNALNFYHRSGVYSFGGYGFWKTNGILRKFNNYTHEWDVVKIDSEIPFSTGYLNWFDPAANRLYISPSEFYQDAFRSDSDAYYKHGERIYALDINSGKWILSGKLSHHFRGVSIPCKWGTLSIYGPDSAVLLNYRGNELVRLSSSLVSQFNNFFIRKNKDFYYFIDTTFYFGNLENDLFDSIPISASSLIPTGKRFFNVEDPMEMGSFNYTLISVAIFVFAGIILIFKRTWLILLIEKWKPLLQIKPTPKNDIAEVSPVKFSNIELELLNMLYQSTLKKSHTTQEELNKLLGLSSKKLSIQKKYRNDIILSVNQKWMIQKNISDTLIERKRSADDMRIYHYRIKNYWLDDLAAFL